MVQLVRATIYSLDGLEKNVRAAVTRCSTEDERLTKALLYYEHARFLFRMCEYAGFFSPHFSFLLTSAYLNLWKAITLILGEPGTDLDYQSRFRSFELPKNYWRDEVQPLAEVRNAFDVAHYSMDSAAIERVETSFGKAEQLCRTVLRAYADYLVNPTSAAGGE
jgi:hypothetical protein